MRDPYQVLGVARGRERCGNQESLPPPRQGAAPDRNREDPKAQDRFSELNTAYEIVGDETKRKQFDRGEIDAEGKPKFQGFEGMGAGRGGRSGGFEFNFGQGGAPFGRGSAGGSGGDAGFDASDIFSSLFGEAAGAPAASPSRRSHRSRASRSRSRWSRPRRRDAPSQAAAAGARSRSRFPRASATAR